MPETTTPASAATAAQAPIIVRPPLTGSEPLDAVARFIIAKLHAETGKRADGSDRWTFTGSSIAYAESGLRFDLSRTDSGVSPYLLACPAGRQEVSGSSGTEPKNVTAKLHASGEIVLAKVVTAALVHAQRKADAAERARIRATIGEALRAKLIAYATPLLDALPAPTRAGTFAPGDLGGSRRTWTWDLTAREGDSDTGLKTGVSLRIEAPVTAPAGGVDAYDPRKAPVHVTVGFGSYSSGQRVMVLPEACAFVAAQAKAMSLLRDALTPREEPRTVELTDPRVCPACHRDDSVEVDPALRTGPGAVPYTHVCRACGNGYTPGYDRAAEMALHAASNAAH